MAIEPQVRPGRHAGSGIDDAGSGDATLSMSMGIAEGIEGNDAQRVLQRAWLALQAARQTGNGNVFVHDGAKTLAVKVGAYAR